MYILYLDNMNYGWITIIHITTDNAFWNCVFAMTKIGKIPKKQRNWSRAKGINRNVMIRTFEKMKMTKAERARYIVILIHKHSHTKKTRQKPNILLSVRYNTSLNKTKSHFSPEINCKKK